VIAPTLVTTEKQKVIIDRKLGLMFYNKVLRCEITENARIKKYLAAEYQLVSK